MGLNGARAATESRRAEAPGKSVLTITVAPSAPTASPASGTYTTGPKVALASSTPGATLYYTINGSPPTAASAKYTGPISMPTASVTWTIRAIAVLNGQSSSVAQAAYTVAPELAAPSIIPASGTYNAVQRIQFAPPLAGATIRYTLNGTAPTATSKAYAGETIQVGVSGSVMAIATQSGYTQSAAAIRTYNIVPTLPSISPGAGTYSTGPKITLTSSPANATIYYTTDDSVPTTSSAKYTAPISMPTAPDTWRLRVIAVLGGQTSAVSRQVYTVAPILAAPIVHPAPGTYNSIQSITFSTPPAGATIHYTFNGNPPTSGSNGYTGAPIHVGVTGTIQAIVTRAGYTQSPTTVAAYSIVPPKPVIAPGAGTYATPQKVTIATPVPNNSIHYTTDGSDPTTSPQIYSSSIPLAAATTTTIRAAAAINGVFGEITSAQVTIAESSSTYTEVPAQADALVDSVGVNVHLGFLGTPYQNFALVQNALKTLGVRHIRDGLMALSSTWPGYFTEHNELGQAGIKSSFLISAGQNPALWKSYPQQMAQCFEAFENPNEYDDSGLADWVTPLTQAVTQLSATVRNGAISPSHPVFGPSLVNQSSYPMIGNISAYIDYGNLHNYPGGQNPGTLGWGARDAEGKGYGSIGWQLDNLALDSPGLPVITTETGYTNDLTIAGGVPQSVSAVYLPRTILQQWLANIKRTYLYELVSVGGEDYGLYAADWSAKPAVAAISNLTGLLSDPGPAFLPATLTYTIKGADSSLHHLLLQKRDGTYYLALWLEEGSYNTATATAIAVKPENIQVILPANYQATGYQWDNTGAAKPVTFPGGSTLEMMVTDNLLLLQLTP
jgi:hypothetical protein